MVRWILDINGFYDVLVELVRGILIDYYDLIRWVVCLFELVYYGCLIFVIFVVFYEVGYVLQYQELYGVFVLRYKIFLVVNFVFGVVFMFFLGGMFFGSLNLIGFGIILFLVVVFFQLIILFVEFNVSLCVK